MAKSWPIEAEEYRTQALDACGALRELCDKARLMRGYPLRAATADISTACSDLRRALWACEGIKPAAGQWPQVAKDRRDMAILYADWMKNKVEILRQAESDAHAVALLAEVADLAAGIEERIGTI